MSETFGEIIKQARKEKGYTQRQLAKKVKIDFTYLSKLENDRAGYPPSFEVIESLTDFLDLISRLEELYYLTGRITRDDEKVFQKLVKANYKDMAKLFELWREDPKVVQKLLPPDVSPPEITSTISKLI